MPKLMGHHGFKFTYGKGINQAKANLQIFSYRKNHALEAVVIKYTGVYIGRYNNFSGKLRLRVGSQFFYKSKQHRLILFGYLNAARCVEFFYGKNKLHQKYKYQDTDTDDTQSCCETDKISKHANQANTKHYANDRQNNRQYN